MNKKRIEKCPQCGQKLRFPENLGGMLMACPSCGKKFSSDFKLHGGVNAPPRECKGAGEPQSRGVLRWLYENIFCIWFKS